MKAAALRGALSDRARAGLVHVVTSFVDGDGPSTKAARTALSAIVGAEPRRALVVLERGDELSWLSLRNLPNVHVLVPDQLNTYDVLVNDIVVFTAVGAGRLPGPTGRSGGAATAAAQRRPRLPRQERAGSRSARAE